MSEYTNRSIATMRECLIDPMIKMIERDLEVTKSPFERKGKIEMLADLQLRKHELDFQSRQSVMFGDFFELEATR